ncbi:hypothetical protein TVNIR_2667 [Thioalkalivibrio nitratireducens DSM 14787]|uniref:Uncharacterized protein n=1 Tax=Thioalkalivibrio nitratireducens (strain DSM 14787 / UNIQEM 213 / ALEN2) TaxID=1255043 RepID=L0DZ78_THIND|nr:hypothetical protein TVNIR_2667 [Thioalkalivibrio nitratireducens DSM 14787]
MRVGIAVHSDPFQRQPGGARAGSLRARADRPFCYHRQTCDAGAKEVCKYPD